MSDRKQKDHGAPMLLSGGNPQIPKGEGDAPVSWIEQASNLPGEVM